MALFLVLAHCLLNIKKFIEILTSLYYKFTFNFLFVYLLIKLAAFINIRKWHFFGVGPLLTKTSKFIKIH